MWVVFILLMMVSISSNCCCDNLANGLDCDDRFDCVIDKNLGL